MAPPPRPPSRRRWLVTSVGLAIAVLLSELTLRVLGLPTLSPAFLGPELGEPGFVADEELYWRLGPEAPNVNAVGLRGWWPSGPKRDRELRIVCVGDSCTVGSKAGYESTYGVRLERLLQAELPGFCVRTVLLALPGYSTHQNRVLVDKYLAFLDPDVTVFYCGPWNDYLPAVEVPDSQYAGGARLGGSRLVRLVERALDGRPSEQREDVREAFRTGEAPYGRRVPLPEFRDNVRSMIDRAKALDSQVVVVLPARPERTRSRHPIANTYSEALREVAATASVSTVDAQALFDAYLARCPEPRGFREVDGAPLSICFSDWIHPAPLGHGLLAERLFETLQQMNPGGELDAARPSIEVVPPRVDALSPGSVVLQGDFLDLEGALERIWIGDRWLRSPRVLGPGRLQLDLPEHLAPGDRFLQLSSPVGGSARARLIVEPPDLEVQLRLLGDQLEVTATVFGPAGWRAALWISEGKRAEPARTIYGPFHLVADPDGRPPGLEELEFRFELLQLLSYLGTVGAQGRWELRASASIDPAVVPDLVYVQAGLMAPDGIGGALTDVVELTVR